MDVVNNLDMGDSTSTEDVNLSQKRKMPKRKKEGNAVECEDPDFSLDNSSPKMDATIDPLHESPALPDFLSCQIIVEYNSTEQNEKSKRKKITHNPIEGNNCSSGTSENTFSPKASTPALDMLSGLPIQCFSTDPITSQSCEEVGFCQGDHEEKEQKMIDTTAAKASKPASDMLSGHSFQCFSTDPITSQTCEEVGFCQGDHEEKEQKMIDTTAAKASSPSLDMPSGHQIQYFSTDPITSQTCEEVGSFQVDYEEKELKMINTTAAKAYTPALDMLSGHPVQFFSTEADGKQLDDTEIKRSDLCCAGEQIELNTDNINEQISMTTSSAVDIYVEQLETNGRQLDHAEITRNDPCCAGDVSDLSLHTVRDDHLKISQFPLDRSVSGNRKKLLILDVNGLLADFVSANVTGTRYRPEPEPDFVLKGRKVYKRPFCEDFLEFCFERFHVGVWSSRVKSNVDEAIKFLMGKSASKLLFCWNQSHCTTTRFTTVENIYKPLVFKELRKLWDKEEPDLPWEKGEFNESNTLLIDDSPYKALMNPMHSAIFPYSYQYFHTRDSELGPGGDLRVYLEGLAMAENVKTYVSENPFGQRPIRKANPSWGYYSRVIESVQRSRKPRPSSTGWEDRCSQNNAWRKRWR